MAHACGCFRTSRISLEYAVRRSVSKRSFVAQLEASRTQIIMERISSASVREAGGAGGASSYQALKRADEQWLKMCLGKSQTGDKPEVVTRANCQLNSSEYALLGSELFDVAVCGGTLGIFIATVLAIKGLRVAIVEKGPLLGRIQEWNISKRELVELVKAGILTEEEVNGSIMIQFNPNRCQFNEGAEVLVKDILNLGVSPRILIDILKERFRHAGGQIFENSGFSKAVVFNDAVVITMESKRSIISKLVLDAMGNFSPIMQQMRSGQDPDGACLVVGTCARGFKNNCTGDVIFTNSPMVQIGDSKVQYFWEAFPAGSGDADRTTYLFTYTDMAPSRPTLERMLEDYWDLLPAYQGVKLEEIEVLRVLFGTFPSYRSSPLPAGFDRVLQVGDASGIQSPISFGGFGSITRHIVRVTNGIMEALEYDMLDKESLGLINPYMPNLSGAWMFQRAMTGQNNVDISPNFINSLLSVTFRSMEGLGDPVLQPFLQDVIQFGPLVKTLGSITTSQPGIIPSIIKQVGVATLVEWIQHFFALGMYTVLTQMVAPFMASWIEQLPQKHRYVWHRRIEAWQYGSGLDFHCHM